MTDDKLIGAATVHALSPLLGTDQLRINVILFEPGSRFRPHIHSLDQILYYPVGTGIVAFDGGDDIVVPNGHLVMLPANTIHMHGCTDDGPAVHYSLMRDSETSFEVDCPPGWEKWMPGV